MMLKSNNFAYCISEYLLNRYDQFIDERLCYLIGNSFSLLRLSKSNCLLMDRSFKKLNDYYLESTNPQMLECFTTNLRAILRIDHNNDINDVKWIASDFQKLGNMKTFLNISNLLFDEDIIIHQQPVYALAHISDILDSEFNIENLKNQSIHLELLKSKSIELKISLFLKFWMVQNNEMYNANRYVIITPKFKDYKNTIRKLIFNSLKISYYNLVHSSYSMGSRLLIELHDELKSAKNQVIVNDHRDFLFYSLKKNSILGDGDMDRAYLSYAFEYLNELGYMDNCLLVDITNKSSMYWRKIFDSLLFSKSLSFSELSDMYLCVIDLESRFEDSLKKVLAL